VNAIVRKNTMYNGSERTTALPNPTPTYFDATSSDSPYGGVIRPNTSVVMITTPMCNVLMLPTSASLRMIGMKMMIAGTASMKSPTMTNTATSSSMISCPSLPAKPVIYPATMSGPRRYATIQPNAEAPATAPSGSE